MRVFVRYGAFALIERLVVRDGQAVIGVPDDFQTFQKGDFIVTTGVECGTKWLFVSWHDGKLWRVVMVKEITIMCGCLEPTSKDKIDFHALAAKGRASCPKVKETPIAEAEMVK